MSRARYNSTLAFRDSAGILNLRDETEPQQKITNSHSNRVEPMFLSLRLSRCKFSFSRPLNSQLSLKCPTNSPTLKDTPREYLFLRLRHVQTRPPGPPSGAFPVTGFCGAPLIQ